MNGAAKQTEVARNYSAFDAELTHQALNVRLFMRLLKWAKPYRITLIASALLVIVSSGLSALMPILHYRVVVDGILVPTEASESGPWYYEGLLDLMAWLMDALSAQPLTAVLVMYVVIFVSLMVVNLAHQLLLTSGSLKTLRDLRIDLFASLERKPASFYDHVAVGRVMTRVTNDVENLFELLMGFVGRAGVVFQFFLYLAIMINMSVYLTGVGLLMIPVTVVATYYFRRVMRQIFRRIRDSVSALNQYMQEDLIGIEVVQISGREAMNSANYGTLNQANRNHEFHAINYEVVFETFNMSLASVATVCILWFGGGQVVQESISLGVLILFTQPHQHARDAGGIRRPLLQHTVPFDGIRRAHLPSARLGRTTA